MTSAATSHQLLSLLHCHSKSMQHFSIGATCSPGTLSSPKGCLQNSRLQPAHLTATGGPTATNFLAGLPTSTSTVLQTSHTSVQVTLLFKSLLWEAFPCDCRGQNKPLRPMATVRWQSALVNPWLSLRHVRLESQEQPEPDHTAQPVMPSAAFESYSLSL